MTISNFIPTFSGLAQGGAKKAVCALFALGLCVLPTFAQRRTFEVILSEDSTARLEVYLPAIDSASGRAVVCLPGGSYSSLSMDTEGRQWAPFFLERGTAFAVLQYTLPHGDWRKPLTDAFTAINALRDNATDWALNPEDIGIMGFSAGGHLAASEVTHADTATLPNFQILIYPVITMSKEGRHEASAANFLGNDKDNAALIKFFSADLQVKEGVAPPAFIALSGDDTSVRPAENGLAYYAALQKVGTKVDLHVYADGGHGWGFKPSFAHHDQLLKDLSDWLSKLGK